MSGSQPSPTLLTPAALQLALTISKPTLRRLVEEGLPHVVVSRGPHRARRRYDLARVVAWLEARAASPRPHRGRPHARTRVGIDARRMA